MNYTIWGIPLIIIIYTIYKGIEQARTNKTVDDLNKMLPEERIEYYKRFEKEIEESKGINKKYKIKTLKTLRELIESANKRQEK
jgi:L-lactate utilization protein LutB